MTVGKDPRDNHFKLSLIKSGIRIGGCAFAIAVNYMISPLLGVTILSITMAAAEVVGIAEEL